MYTYEIWDKCSPINGCPAEKAMAAHNIAADEQVYLILQDDQAVMLQTDRNSPALAHFEGETPTIEEMAAKHVEVLEEAEQAAGEGGTTDTPNEDACVAAPVLIEPVRSGTP